MSNLPQIPTPRAVLWREFRIGWLPIIVFTVASIVAVVLWHGVGTSPTLSGVGEGVRSLVSSPQPALLQNILVEPYQMVNKGDPIAIVVPSDSRVQFDLLRAESDLGRLRTQPSIAEQNSMDFVRIQVELLNTKSELAIAKVKLRRAEKDLVRNTPLYKEKLVSEDIYELSLMTRDMYRAEVEEKTKAVTEIENWLNDLRNVGDPLSDQARDKIADSLAKLERAYAIAATSVGPITLSAPITGMVGTLPRQPGEYLVAGETLLVIHSLWSDRVVGYLRQPYPIDPQTGMAVLVTTRTRQRQKFWTQITRVGAQVESITNSLAFLRAGLLMDAGLPIIVVLPPDAKVRPGEIVDMHIHSQRTDSNPVVDPLPGARKEL